MQEIKTPQNLEKPKETRPSTEADKYKPPSKWQRLMYLGTVSHKELLFFTKNFSILLKTGSTMTEALRVLATQAKGKLSMTLNQVNYHIQRGAQLSEALERYPKIFSNIYVSMVSIGEHSGTLEENLEHVGMQLEKSYQLRKKILGAMMYPIIVLIAAFVLGMSISIFILPKLTKIFKSFDVELPVTTRMLMAISDFFQNYGIWAVLGVTGAIVITVWILKLKLTRPITHFLILYIPVVKTISIHFNLSMFCRTLGVLLKSGVTIDDALKICKDTMSNHYYRKFLEHVHVRINAGDFLSDILATKKKLFPATDVQIISVGEKSGTLSESLEYCSEIHESEVNDITRNLSNILEPILLIGIGIIVAILALSVITPIYSITGQFRK